MIELDLGNVLLKPSQRKQLMSWLRRSLEFGKRIGDFVLKISVQRSGRQYEIKAQVHDSAGDFGLRTRQNDWRSAFRDLIRMLTNQLHAQWLRRTVMG